ncbi:MAG TPA: phytanoyl-CoA dioxygenase family protein [Acidimicrobiales bacterium]|nr:phytanoyl-CoA dioxygenase family protein [Acidimicrobiales bacterium]
MLEDDEIAAFVRDGYVVVQSAVPTGIMEECRREVAADLLARGIAWDDASTWQRPVERIPCPESPAFEAAGTQPILWSAYDQLLTPGSWWRRPGVGGTIPVRFPHPDDPGDAGWHMDGSFQHEGEDGYWINLRSRDRGLLLLFLLTDVGPDDAPTEIKVGSHLDVPGLVEPLGDTGASFATVSHLLPTTTLDRPSAFATGRAGDVYICHPFLVHRATWPHRGRHPRAVAQPGVHIHEPFGLDEQSACPVERAILLGLGGTRSEARPGGH